METGGPDFSGLAGGVGGHRRGIPGGSRATGQTDRATVRSDGSAKPDETLTCRLCHSVWPYDSDKQGINHGGHNTDIFKQINELNNGYQGLPIIDTNLLSEALSLTVPHGRRERDE